MTKNLIKSIAIVLVLVPMAVFAQTPAASPASTPVSDSGSTAGPSTSDSSATVTSASTGGSTSTAGPSTGNSTGTASNTSTGGSTSTAGPSTGGSSSTASDTILPTPTATPIPPPVTPPTGGNGGNGGNGSGGSSSGSSSSSGSRVAYPYACNQFTTFMWYGYNHDTTQVIKLQTFLRDAEKLNITVNGIFDKQTENAVIAFQNKYSGTVMGPWGASQGSGYVYITTIKQINKIACSIPLALNPQELAIINNYKNRRSGSTVIVTPKEQSSTIQIEVKGEDNTITLTSNEETNTENVASVIKPSIMNRFWNFLVYLFK